MVEPWIDGLWGALAKILAPKDGTESSSSQIDDPSSAEKTTDNPKTPDDTDNPKTTADTDNPKTAADTDNPKTAADTDNPKTTADTDNPKTAADTDNPKTAANTDNPKNTANRTDNPKITADPVTGSVTGNTDNPKSTADTDNPKTTDTASELEMLSTNLKELQVSSPPLVTPNLEPRTLVEATPPSLSSVPAVEVRGQAASFNESVLRTCSRELVGVALNLPTLPPAYISVQLKEVSW